MRDEPRWWTPLAVVGLVGLIAVTVGEAISFFARGRR